MDTYAYECQQAIMNISAGACLVFLYDRIYPDMNDAVWHGLVANVQQARELRKMVSDLSGGDFELDFIELNEGLPMIDLDEAKRQLAKEMGHE